MKNSDDCLNSGKQELQLRVTGDGRNIQRGRGGFLKVTQHVAVPRLVPDLDAQGTRSPRRSAVGGQVPEAEQWGGACEAYHRQCWCDGPAG